MIYEFDNNEFNETLTNVQNSEEPVDRCRRSIQEPLTTKTNINQNILQNTKSYQN